MRIVSGRLGGLRLVAPKGQATRPTGDRVKEALFAILGPIGGEGSRALDLYAGSGALGLEALSRGCEQIVFVEEARGALEALRANIAHVHAEAACLVVPKAVERAFPTLEGEPFTLVLADPPYADVTSGKAVRALASLVAKGVLSPRGRLVLEHASADDSPSIEGLAAPDTRRYGDTSLAFYEFP